MNTKDHDPIFTFREIKRFDEKIKSKKGILKTTTKEGLPVQARQSTTMMVA